MNLCSFIYVLLQQPSFECKLRNSCEPLKNLKLFLEFLRIRIRIAFFVLFFSSRFACFAFFFAAACSARSSCWRFLRAKSTFRGTVVLPKERNSSTERAIFKSHSIKYRAPNEGAMLTERIASYVGVCRLSQMSTTTSDDLKCKPSLQIQDLFLRFQM